MSKVVNMEIDFNRAMNRVIRVLLALMVVMFVFALLMSCGTTEYVPVVQTNTEHHWHTDSVHEKDSTYHEKTTTIMQLDSAAMAKYGIQLKSAERAWLVKTEELQRQIDRLEAMSVSKDSVHDSIPIPYPVEVIREVPAELTWWQKLIMWIGNIGLIAILGVIGYYGVKLWRVYKFF